VKGAGMSQISDRRLVAYITAILTRPSRIVREIEIERLIGRVIMTTGADTETILAPIDKIVGNKSDVRLDGLESVTWRVPACPPRPGLNRAPRRPPDRRFPQSQPKDGDGSGPAVRGRS
jgi:hypothetical protein